MAIYIWFTVTEGSFLDTNSPVFATDENDLISDCTAEDSLHTIQSFTMFFIFKFADQNVQS